MELTSIRSWFQSQDLTKGQATQIRIIQSALRVFSEKGVSNVTLQMIAKNAGVSHPLILKHFGSKEDLLLYVRQYVKVSCQAWVDEAMDESMNGHKALFTHCYESLQWIFQKPDEGKMIIFTYYYNSLSRTGENLSMNARKIGIQRILKYVLQCQREGYLGKKENPEFIAEILQESLIGLAVAILTSGDLGESKLPPRYKKKIRLLVDGLIRK